MNISSNAGASSRIRSNSKKRRNRGISSAVESLEARTLFSGPQVVNCIINGAGQAAGPTVYVIASFHDPDLDSFSSATIDWGDGSTPSEMGYYYGDYYEAEHGYSEDGDYNAVITAYDQYDESEENPILIVMRSVAPTATMGNGGPINEGSSATVAMSGAYDPSSDDTTEGFHYSFAKTTGALATTYSTASGSASAQINFTNNGTYTVYGRIFDQHDNYTQYSTVVTVNNVAPTAASVENNGPVAKSTAATITVGTISDPSSDDLTVGMTYSYDLNNDGDFTDFGEFNGNGSYSQPVTYATPGTYTVHVRVTDQDGGHSDYYTDVLVVDVDSAGVIMTGAELNFASTVGDWTGGAAQDENFCFNYACNAPTGTMSGALEYLGQTPYERVTEEGAIWLGDSAASTLQLPTLVGSGWQNYYVAAVVEDINLSQSIHYLRHSDKHSGGSWDQKDQAAVPVDMDDNGYVDSLSSNQNDPLMTINSRSYYLVGYFAVPVDPPLDV